MQTKMGQAKIVTRLVSKTKCLKNKLTGQHGHQEFQNECSRASEELSRTSEATKTRSSKLASMKNLFKPSYKPLSV